MSESRAFHCWAWKEKQTKRNLETKKKGGGGILNTRRDGISKPLAIHTQDWWVNCSANCSWKVVNMAGQLIRINSAPAATCVLFFFAPAKRIIALPQIRECYAEVKGEKKKRHRKRKLLIKLRLPQLTSSSWKANANHLSVRKHNQWG